jgi:hypothetical protein
MQHKKKKELKRNGKVFNFFWLCNVFFVLFFFKMTKNPKANKNVQQKINDYQSIVGC